MATMGHSLLTAMVNSSGKCHTSHNDACNGIFTLAQAYKENDK